MPQVAPFRGLHYALDRFGGDRIPDRVRAVDDPERHPGRMADVTDLACPPYDVIDAAARDELLRRHERNAVRLELSAEADPHAAAAEALAAWRADGTLAEPASASVYYYAYSTRDRPDDPTVQGILARVLLEPFGGEVRAHEHTMPGPKADRLALLHATRTQLSPILTVYFDRSERYRHVMSRAWSDEWRARDGDGLLHTLAAVEPDDRLLGYLARQRLYIADGHHRYETALAYQADVRSDPELAARPIGALGADWIMMLLVNAELEDLEIRATHRVVRNGDGARLRELVEDPGPAFRARRVAPAAIGDELATASDAAAPVFGLVLGGDEGWMLEGVPDAVAERMAREPASSAVRRLDLAVLHAAILDDRLGIDAGAVAAGDRLAYTRDPDDAIRRVTAGEASAAILVRPTRMEQLAAVATAGDVMPQKSTFFYPKLLTGLVFNPLEA